MHLMLPMMHNAPNYRNGGYPEPFAKITTLALFPLMAVGLFLAGMHIKNKRDSVFCFALSSFCLLSEACLIRILWAERPQTRQRAPLLPINNEPQPTSR